MSILTFEAKCDRKIMAVYVKAGYSLANARVSVCWKRVFVSVNLHISIRAMFPSPLDSLIQEYLGLLHKHPKKFTTMNLSW